MCLILFSFDPSSKNPLVLAANRDEFFARPSAAAQYWDDAPNVLAGRDLIAGGTWLGITRSGRFAAVTNVREPNVVVENALSRGDLTRDFLTGTMAPKEYLLSLEKKQARYSGFNLLVGEFTKNDNSLWYLSNRKEGIHALQAGIYGLSNHLLDSPWPKTNEGKRFLQVALSNEEPSTCEENNASLNDQQTKQNYDKSHEQHHHKQLRHFLENSALADDEILPKTGVSYEKEKALSAAFITLPEINYGTRTSTVLTVEPEKITFSEKNYLDENNRQQCKDNVTEFFDITRS